MRPSRVFHSPLLLVLPPLPRSPNLASCARRTGPRRTDKLIAVFIAAVSRMFLSWEHREIRRGLLQHARVGRPRLQAVEIGGNVAVAVAKRHDLVGIEQRRSRGAIGKTEGFTDRPGPGFHLTVDHAVAGPQPRFGFFDAMRIPFGF